MYIYAHTFAGESFIQECMNIGGKMFRAQCYKSMAIQRQIQLQAAYCTHMKNGNLVIIPDLETLKFLHDEILPSAWVCVG